MSKKLFTLFLGLFVIYAYSQSIESLECGTDIVMQDHLELVSEQIVKDNSFNIKMSSVLKQDATNMSSDQVYEIPIVVHVISDGSPIGSANNRSDTAIKSWIDYTNKKFAGDVSAGMSPLSAKIPVKLVLAKIDPNCNPTTGINRIDASNLPKYVSKGVTISNDSTRVSLNQIRTLVKWDPTRYYNIYMVNKLYAGNNNIGGVAQYPNGSKDDTFVTGTSSYSGGYTLSHEFGHALGLAHTFEGATSTTCPPNNNCSSQGDKVCDTEPLRHISCPSSGSINPCTNLPYSPATLKNIMGGTCTPDRWTQGQASRATSQLLTYRQNLIDSPVLNASIIADNTASLVQTCTPTSIQSPTNNQIGIKSVKFGNINNRSQPFNLAGNNFYENFTENYCLGVTKTTILQNTSTTLSISVGNNKHMVKAYIDYNNDGQFNENTEQVFNQNIAGNSTGMTSVTPPSNAVTNIPVRMRIIGDAETVNITACYTPQYGQIEDYSVIILPNGTLMTMENDKPRTYITNSGNSVFVKSDDKISSITIYDAAGRLLSNKFNINAKEFSQNINSTNIIVTVKVVLYNGSSLSKKLKF